ncbi:MAG TPA: Maf family protein [Candidatus Eisenbacteria bacterium]|nr:Maf family protein [Candidatus Eisenbacteria bacterium]
MRANLLNPFGPHLVLASRSPRRAELLRLVGARFEVVPADVDERPLPDERAEAHVLRLAEAKARAALDAIPSASPGEREPETLVLGADTIVTLDREILGKPADREEATRMLRALSGRVHEVWTGLFLYDPAHARGVGEAVRSIVKFVRLSEEEIERYVATSEPLDKAGAYAVQGYGAVFVEAIEGSYSNVVGLPLGHLRHLLRLARGEDDEFAGAEPDTEEA